VEGVEPSKDKTLISESCHGKGAPLEPLVIELLTTVQNEIRSILD
jgi:hypothetical protein